MVAFRMPSLGADMESGILVEWLVKPGDRVERGQIIAVVETQKGAIDIETFTAGVVESLLVETGTDVPVGTVLAEIRSDAVVEAGPPPPSPPATPSAEPAAAVVVAAPPHESKRASPRARKRAAELGIDLAEVVGTGEGGAITTDDVARHAAAPSRADTGMRQAIAAAMSRSKREIPHYYLWHTIDLEPALRWLEASNAASSVATRVLPAIVLVRAVALALREMPELGSTWVDGRAVPPPGIHVGFAISIRDGGLVNPALHDADRGSLVELMQKARDVTERARRGGLRASELSDAVITVTNLGDLGTDGVLAVIHPPQTAIVGFGAIRARPWVIDEAIAVRRVVEVSLAADHRVSDGHGGARFLRAIERILQRPEGL